MTCLVRSTLAFGVALLAACSGGKGSSPSPEAVYPEGGGSPSDGALATDAAALARLEDCNLIATTVAPWYLGELAPRRAALEAAVAAGRLGYSQAAADACAAAYAAATCAAVDYAWNLSGPEPTPCRAVFRGKVALGSLCLDDGECVSGRCKYGSTCPGTCTAWRKEGESCDSDPCAPGLACLTAASSARSCQPAGTPGDVGQPCALTTPWCAPGGYCDVTSGTCRARIAATRSCPGYVPGECVLGVSCRSGTCRTDAGPGESCASAQCRMGLVCAAASHTCTGDLPSVGEDCTAVGACGEGRCLGDTTKTCASFTLGQDCSALVAAGVYGVCDDGTYCIGSATKTCTAATAQIGKPCTSYNGPASSASTLCAHADGYTYCDATSGTCKQDIVSCY